MSATTTPAPPQTIKGIDEYTGERLGILTDNKGNLKTTNVVIEEILKEVLNELRMIRQHFEIINDETIR